MKKIYLSFFILTFISCAEIQYDGSKRLVFQTVVKNYNGQPLPNCQVEITTSTEYDSDLISKGKTNENGEVTLIFPFPDPENVNINLNIYNEEASYLPKQLLNIKKKDFVNYKFVLQNANLLKRDETAPLRILYNQSSPNNVIKRVTINGIYYIYQEIYNNTDDYYYELPVEILLKKNQAFQLKYTVLNTQTNSVTNYTVDLTIGNEQTSYTINY